MATNLASTSRRKREKITSVAVTACNLSTSYSKSKMWNYYTKLGDTYVECKVCRKQFSLQNSSTAMRDHLLKGHSVHGSANPLIKEHPELDSPDDVGVVKRLKQTMPSEILCPSESRTQLIANLLLEMVYRDLHPLQVVENKGFAQLITYLEPNIDLPSQTQLADMLWHNCAVMKQQLKHILQGAPTVVISIENWVDHSKMPYLSVAVNIIDSKWRFCRYLLETQSVEPGKVEDGLADRLLSTLLKFGLATNLVSCVVHDQSSLLSVYSRSFKEDYGWTSLCCSAHILQNCVQAGLEVQDVKEALTAARGLVSIFQEDFKTSCFLNSKLEAMNKPRLVLDTDMYWISTLEMCQNLLDLKWAILSVLEEQNTNNLSEQHWKLLQELAPMLKTVWIATVFLQEEQNVSISSLMPCVFGIFTSVGQYLEASNGTIKAVANQIRSEICRHWDMMDEGKLINSPAVLASFLDPRFKELRFLKPWARGEIHIKMRNILTQMCEPCSPNQLWSLTCVNESCNDSLLQPAAQDGVTSFVSESCVYDLLLGRDPTDYMPEAHQQLENYIVEPVCKRTTDPLQWWNSNQPRYPALAHLARQYLSIPATAVKPEDAFSLRQGPRQNRKASLEPKHMDPILFLHQNKDLLE
ncbi:E3 SUMO-protein ligase ZBED1-like [Gastrophryne carolinensis]